MTDSQLPLSQQDVHPAEAPIDEHELNYFGMWVFLSSEVLFFGVMFTGYLIYRRAYPAAFADASQHLDLLLGSINTAILLTSSFTMALAVNAAQSGKKRSLIIFLLGTMFLGACFLGVKGLEYSHEFQENLFPGGNFVYPGQYQEQAKLFFSLYFTMTGFHALHMLVGLTALAIMVFLSWRNKITSAHYSPVELTGLFWHFVDIVWIFIYPLMYLIHVS